MRSGQADGALHQIEVVVADDHAIVRRGIRYVLEADTGIRIVGEAGTAGEVLELARNGLGDVLLLDLVMPGTDGIELLEAVRRLRPELAVLVLTMHSADQYAVRALRAGAVAYLTKDGASDELVSAVRAVSTGRRYLTDQVAQQLAAHLGPRDDRPVHERLSNREYQVLRLLGSAFSLRQIAAQLHLSERTVATYRGRLLEKIHARNTAELIRYAVRHGLVD